MGQCWGRFLSVDPWRTVILQGERANGQEEHVDKTLYVSDQLTPPGALVGRQYVQRNVRITRASHSIEIEKAGQREAQLPST